LAFLRATQREMRNVTPERPMVPGISPGMAQQVMEYARARAPESVTVEDLMRRFNMSRQQAQRAYEQIIQAHEITPLSVQAAPAESPAAPPTVPEAAPGHRLDPAIEFLRQLEAQGVDISRIGTSSQVMQPAMQVHPRLEWWQRRMEAMERARQAAQAQRPDVLERLRQQFEQRTQPVEPSGTQHEVLHG